MIKKAISFIGIFLFMVVMCVDWVGLMENIINIPSWCGWVIVAMMVVACIVLTIYIIKTIINMYCEYIED